jgi:hypothetical protein
MIADKIISLATSNAALEGHFSTFGFILSKLMNSLSFKSVDRLVFTKPESVL